MSPIEVVAEPHVIDLNHGFLQNFAQSTLWLIACEYPELPLSELHINLPYSPRLAPLPAGFFPRAPLPGHLSRPPLPCKPYPNPWQASTHSRDYPAKFYPPSLRPYAIQRDDPGAPIPTLQQLRELQRKEEEEEEEKERRRRTAAIPWEQSPLKRPFSTAFLPLIPPTPARRYPTTREQYLDSSRPGSTEDGQPTRADRALTERGEKKKSK